MLPTFKPFGSRSCGSKCRDITHQEHLDQGEFRVCLHVLCATSAACNWRVKVRTRSSGLWNPIPATTPGRGGLSPGEPIPFCFLFPDNIINEWYTLQQIPHACPLRFCILV